MELPEPKFMSTEYIYYDDEGLKIREESPQWIKDEYKVFMSETYEVKEWKHLLK